MCIERFRDEEGERRHALEHTKAVRYYRLKEHTQCWLRVREGKRVGQEEEEEEEDARRTGSRKASMIDASVLVSVSVHPHASASSTKLTVHAKTAANISESLFKTADPSPARP